MLGRLGHGSRGEAVDVGSLMIQTLICQMQTRTEDSLDLGAVPMGEVGGQRWAAGRSADEDSQELIGSERNRYAVRNNRAGSGTAITVGAEVARPANVVAEAWGVPVAHRRRAFLVASWNARRRRHGNDKGKADDNEQQGERSSDNGSIHRPSFRVRLWACTRC